MKKVADKQILMAADFAGYPLKEEIKKYLEKKGWILWGQALKRIENQAAARDL